MGALGTALLAAAAALVTSLGMGGGAVLLLYLTAVKGMDQLEAQGLIYLESAGRKAKTVCLTETGTGFAQKTAMRILNMENEILASWAPEEVAQYMDLTERFLLALRERAAKL